jgi:ADP-ribosyl-[dinitrogen reductase] hydrolase
MESRSRFRGCLVGLAAGDAVGTTVEFSRRGTFEPLTDMTGGGPYKLKPGEWTDDTSMALCLATSLLHKNGFDAADQMDRYLNWMNNGYMSSTGECFDIGGTVLKALEKYRDTGEPVAGSTHTRSAGNGCIMRLAPVPMFYVNDNAAAVQRSVESSRTTHGAQECLDACALFGELLVRALQCESKEQLLQGSEQTHNLSPAIASIAAGDYQSKHEDDIRGNGYVVQSLEAALWCFQTTGSFKDAILKAANLGDDADTTAAICGQIAGAHYGFDNIPRDWRDQLACYELIIDLADMLYEVSQ